MLGIGGEGLGIRGLELRRQGSGVKNLKLDARLLLNQRVHHGWT